MTTPGKHAPTRTNPNRGDEIEEEGQEERDAVRNPAGEPGPRKPEELDEEFERSLRVEDEDEDDDGDTIRR